jgi:glycine C-acetyltransferase
MRLRFRGGTAPLGKAQHLELRNDALQRHAQAVADPHPMSGFYPVGVQVNLAAGDGGGGQASRLVKPAMPQPLVQSVNIGFVHARYNSCMSAIQEFRARLDQDTQALDAAGLLKRERVIGSAQGPVVTLADGREMVNLCANNYLGLANHPAVVAAAHDALDRYGYGVASVRFICGTQRVHRELEERLSAYLSMEDAILYSSCFDANGGLFETLLDDQDAVISDALNHASIIDGIRLCKARRLRYANNDMNELEQALKDSQDARVRLIATDGVFSMDGSIAKLDAICGLADRYGALVMVDDSHATGFIGARGRGSHELRGVTDRIDIMTGTLGKALGGASGGYVAARKEIVAWLRQRSRPYLFSNSIAPPVAAATLKVLDILESSPELRERVHGNARYFRSQMQALGFDLLPGEHPIIPVMLGEAPLAVRLAEQCQESGAYVVAFAFPVVPHGKARIRTQMNAAHTTAQLDRVVQAFGRAGRDLGIIS